MVQAHAVLLAALGIHACALAAPPLPASTMNTLSTSGQPAPRHFWVYLKDKGVARADLPAALDACQVAMDPRTLWRRSMRRTDPSALPGGLVDERDLPIPAAYRDAIEGTGARVRAISRWLSAVSVDATPEQLASIARLGFVDRIAPVVGGVRRPGLECDEVTSAGAGGGATTRDFYGNESAQLHQIKIPEVHARGYTGQGVVVGILDTGFQRSHNAFNQAGHLLNVLAEHDFVMNDGNTAIEPGDNSEQHRHGTWILGCIGAYWPSTLVGGAYDASFVLAKTEDVTSETPIEEDYYVAGLEFLEAHGADMATSSLGYIDWYTQAQLNGNTAVTTLAVNVATGNGLVCCTAAGNAGHDTSPTTSTLIAPADAPREITCGAVDVAGLIADFSSSGPTADGRLKPEVLACGVNTNTVSSATNTGIGIVSGTSLSTPLVAAGVACLIGARPAWTVDHIRYALEHTATDFAASGLTDPLFIRGYGIADFDAALTSLCPADLDDGAGLGTPDGGVDINDLLFFLAKYEAGSLAADLDNGSGTGTPDAGVDINDLLFFLERYEGGC